LISEFPTAPQFEPDAEKHRRSLARSLNLVMRGKSNNVIEATLTANAASTTITDERIGVSTAIIPVPLTANAAAELGNGTMYVSNTGRVNGSASITHANNAQTDRTFKLILVG